MKGALGFLFLGGAAFMLYEYFKGGGTVPGIPSSTGTPSNTTATGPATQGSPVPKIAFVTAGGNSARMNVGEAWQVSITGAPANSPVMVTAVGTDGENLTMQIGVTDGSGTLQVSGTAESTHLGSWHEVWTIGTITLGSWDFSIVQPGLGKYGEMLGTPIDYAYGYNEYLN